MIAFPPSLTPAEGEGLRTLIRRLLAAGEPPVVRALLFGSKARGDFDDDSDIDLLVICDLPPSDREAASRILGRDARIVSRETGLRIEVWTVTTADLEIGSRTPMLIDAIEDGHTLWPVDAPPLRLAFTPDDGIFCAGRLLEWVEEGMHLIPEALAAGRYADAAQRARDDITRLASAALLLAGETRHRRIGTLELFAERFIETGLYPATLLPALAWAARAYPPDGGRGTERPPPSAAAVRTAELGRHFAIEVADAIIPDLLGHLSGRTQRSLDSPVRLRGLLFGR